MYIGTGSGNRGVPTTETECFALPDTAAADDDIPFGSLANSATTVERSWCNCHGTCTTKATFAFEDGAGNAMTGSPTCSDVGTVATATEITGGGSLTAREELRFDVTNTPSPETDTYSICVEFSYD